MTDAKPTSQKGKDEVDRMKRAQGVSQGIWDATSWFVKFLGAAAFFTVGVGLRLGQDPDRVAVSLLGLAAVLAAVLGAAAYALNHTMTQSRISTADASANRRGAAYAILSIAFAVQLLSLGATPLLQGLAAYQAVLASDPKRDLDAGLAQRLDIYAASSDASALVKQYCDKHIADAASANFLADCLQFGQQVLPTAERARQMAEALRRGS